MPITDHQREQRRKHIGASDVPAILGRDPYKSLHDVWLAKTGRVEFAEPGEAAVAGLHFEDGILSWASDQGGLGKLLRNQYRSYPLAHLGSNLDAVRVDAPEPVEAKTAGLYGPLGEKWGEAGTDEVPDRVLVQVHAQMLCLAPDALEGLAHVAAFIGGRGFVLYRIVRSQKLCDVIAERCIEFWEDHVLADKPPDGVLPSYDVIRLARRMPKTVATIPAGLVEAWRAASEAAKYAAREEERAKVAVIAALGDADAGDWGDESQHLTYYEQTRSAHYVKESTFRVLRQKKGQASGERIGSGEQANREPESVPDAPEGAGCDSGRGREAHDPGADGQGDAGGGEPVAEASGVRAGLHLAQPDDGGRTGA